MAGGEWLRRGRLIARVEFRRSVRKVRGNGLQLLGLLFGGGIFTLVAVAGAVLLVLTEPDLSGLTLEPGIRGSFALQWLFAGLILTTRAVSNHAEPDAGPFLLTTVSVPSAVLGHLLAETYRTLAYVGPPVVVVGLALAYVTGSALTVLAVALAVVLFTVTAVVGATLLAYVVRYLITCVPFVARNRSLLGVVAVLLFFGAYALVQTRTAAFDALGWLPPGWLVDLALVATPASVSTELAAATVGLSLGWVGLAGAGAARLAAPLWLGDSVEERVEAVKARVGTDAADPLAAAVRPLAFPVGRPTTRRVAQRTVLLARRAPVKLSFLLTPLVLVGVTVGNVLSAEGGSALDVALVAPAVAVGLPWVAGAALALNPLGDEGRVLPATLTSLADGRAYARGLVLPGVLYGVPLSLVATALAGVLAGYDPVAVGTLAALAAVTTVWSACLAPGVGVALPRYDAVRVVRGRELVPPRLLAIALHAVAVFGLGGLATTALVSPTGARGALALIVGGLFALPFDLAGGPDAPSAAVAEALRDLGRSLGTAPVETVRVVGTLGPTLFGLALGALALRYVHHRFRTYTVD